jgi:hypothetical protein
MTTLKSVQKDYTIINTAAGIFLEKLSGNNLKEDICIAAEMVGLKLLRASNIDLSGMAPGTALLGAISESAYENIHRFMIEWALSNGMNPKKISQLRIPEDAKDYHPEITNLEQLFDEMCQRITLTVAYYPFVATTSAMRLVLAGEKLGLLDSTTGLAITLFHIFAGSKTVPYPPAA